MPAAPPHETDHEDAAWLTMPVGRAEAGAGLLATAATDVLEIADIRVADRLLTLLVGSAALAASSGAPGASPPAELGLEVDKKLGRATVLSKVGALLDPSDDRSLPGPGSQEWIDASFEGSLLLRGVLPRTLLRWAGAPPGQLDRVSSLVLLGDRIATVLLSELGSSHRRFAVARRPNQLLIRLWQLSPGQRAAVTAAIDAEIPDASTRSGRADDGGRGDMQISVPIERAIGGRRPRLRLQWANGAFIDRAGGRQQSDSPA